LENLMSHLTYYRPDGVIGVGFEITHSAKTMHSIAWPDRCSERMLDDELTRKQIRVAGPAEQTDAPVVAPPAASEGPDVAEGVNSAGTSPEVKLAPEVEDDYVGSDMQESEEADESFWNSELEGSSLEVEPISEAQAIRDYLTEHPKVANKTVVKALAVRGIEISSSQVTRQRKNLKEDGVI